MQFFFTQLVPVFFSGWTIKLCMTRGAKVVALPSVSGVRGAILPVQVDEWHEDRRKFGFESWIDSQVNEAIFNTIVAYYQVCGEGSTTGPGENPQLLEKIENWKKGEVVAKGM